MLYFLGRSIYWFIARAFFRLRTVGKNNIPQKGSMIIASNHVSNFDPPFVGAALERRVYFLGKEELFRISLFGKVLKRANVIPVKRMGYTADSIRKAIEVLNKGECLVVFPEGTRSKDGNFGQVKRGVGMLVAKTKVPVLPVLVENSNDFFSFKPLRITFGKPLYYNDFPDNKKSHKMISEDILENIKKLKSSNT